jgi:membrane protease subunit (stomatin/prohibitin family)
VRLRAYGNYAIQIREPLVFVNALAGTMGSFVTGDIKDYLRDIIISRLNDYLGEKVRTIFDLPKQYDEMGQEVHERLDHDFRRYGIDLADFYITSITPPEEVEKAIDERAQMAALGDLDKFLKMKAARALEGAGSGGSPAGDMAGLGAGAGMGAGLGMMLPGMIFESIKGRGGASTAAQDGVACPACHSEVSAAARFCPSCGESLVAGDRCQNCETPLSPDAKFCSRCGEPVGVVERNCPNCQAKLPAGARFCMECGERVIV